MDGKDFLISFILFLIAVTGIAFVASLDVMFIGLAPFVIGPTVLMMKDAIKKKKPEV